MRGEHERYEELAVGHVLGGLDAGEAADFRTHLLGCRDCRLRVAELRDLAADLAAAERDERARAQVRTEVVRSEDVHEPQASPGRIGIRHVTVAAVVVILLASAMAFWNLHLRTVAAGYSQAAGYRGETLRQLSTGLSVVAESAEGVSAYVVIDGESVAFTVSGLPSLVEGERLEVWLIDDGEATPAGPPVSAESVADGTLAGHVDDHDADQLVITRERGPRRPEPSGAELVRADLGAAA